MEKMSVNPIVEVTAALPALAVIEGKVMVSSLELSLTFGKRHGDVIRVIEEVRSGCVDGFGERNFASAEYQDGQNKARKVYCMTRDGFSLIAMGLTGNAALKFKQAYINEFNRMEAELIDKAQQLAQVKRDELGLERPWATETEEKLVGYWKFTKSDTQALGIALKHLVSRLPATVFSDSKFEELRQGYVDRFMYGLTQTKHDLKMVTAANRYAMALVVMSEMGAAMTLGINGVLMKLSENPM